MVEWTMGDKLVARPFPAKRRRGPPKRIEAGQLILTTISLIKVNAMSARMAASLASENKWANAGFNSHLAAIEYIRKNPDVIAAISQIIKTQDKPE